MVGRLGRPHGLRGELTVLVRTDDPAGRFVPGAGFVTEPDVGALVLARARSHQGRWLLTFDGVADRDAAERLRDVSLLVEPRDDEAEEDAWPVAQLVGLRAVHVAGYPLGTVTALESGAAQDLLVVAPADGGDVVRVPFVTALVPDVDVAGGTVTVDPPGGLFDDAAEVAGGPGGEG